MPELPEVQAIVDALTERAVGRAVVRVDVVAINVLKTYDPPVSALAGLVVDGVIRRGKFLDLDVGGLHLVIHLARAGWLRWREELPAAPPKPGKGPLALRVHLDGSGPSTTGFDLTEQGTKKGLAVYVVRDPAEVAGIARLGPEPLDPAFTVDTLGALLAGSRQQIKGLLRDQSIVAGIGNAYSDDILHAARMSPFKPAGAFIFLNERCAKREYLGILMLLVGVIFVTTNGAFEKLSLSENLLGNLLIIGACFFWGIDNNLSKFLSRKRDIVLVTGLKCSVGGLALLSVSFLLGFSFTIPLISIPYILFVGAFSIAFSILFFLFALRKIGSMRTGVIFSLSSLFGAALAFVLLGEVFTPIQLIAGLIMLLGIYVLYRCGKRK